MSRVVLSPRSTLYETALSKRTIGSIAPALDHIVEGLDQVEKHDVRGNVMLRTVAKSLDNLLQLLITSAEVGQQSQREVSISRVSSRFSKMRRQRPVDGCRIAFVGIRSDSPLSSQLVEEFDEQSSDHAVRSAPMIRPHLEGRPTRPLSATRTLEKPLDPAETVFDRIWSPVPLRVVMVRMGRTKSDAVRMVTPATTVVMMGRMMRVVMRMAMMMRRHESTPKIQSPTESSLPRFRSSQSSK